MADGTQGDSARLNFTTFLLSLGTSALVQMGDVPDPTGQEETDLAGARQTIDLLDLLHEKTRGNLDEDEERLLKRLRTDLKLRFVEAAKRG